jgi:hypothetical protein
MRLGSKIVAGVIAGALALAQTPSAWAQGQPGKPGQTAPAKPPGAAAAPGKADLAAAKKHYGDGDKKFKAGDYAGAEAEFKAANDIKATPQTERYIGMCEDALGHFQSAAEWYDRFLAHVPDKMAAQGDEIRKRDAEIKALPGKVHVDSNPPGAAVTVDDKPQSAPTPMDVDLPPGQHVIKLTEQGRLPTTKTIDVAFASTQAVTADLDPEPPPPPPPAPVAEVPPPPPPAPPPPPPEPRSKVPAYVTGGLAIAAAGVGTVFGIMALSDKSDFDKHPTTSTADDGDTHALIADMAFGVALTFGVTSAVLFLTKDEPPAAASARPDPKAMARADAARSRVTITPTPMVGPHSGGAGVLLRF